MARIIKKARFIEEESFDLVFQRTDHPGCAYSFSCDSWGNVDTNSLPELALENYKRCRTGQAPVRSPEIRRHVHSYLEPAVLRCDCGRKVELYYFTNTCDCGADYNSSGQRLAPREQWGEETGEPWYECY